MIVIGHPTNLMLVSDHTSSFVGAAAQLVLDHVGA